MDSVKEVLLSRKDIAIRFLYTLLFLVVFEVLKAIIQITALCQYIYMLITTTHSQPLRQFSNKLSAYTYKVMRFITLNENSKPYPFSKFPEEIEPSDSEVTFK